MEQPQIGYSRTWKRLAASSLLLLKSCANKKGLSKNGQPFGSTADRDY